MKPVTWSTFNDTTNDYMKKETHANKDADTVIVVFDRYDDPNYNKAAEREQRENSYNGKHLYYVKGSRVTPSWERFLNVAANKMSFNCFCVWENGIYAAIKANSRKGIFPSWRLCYIFYKFITLPASGCKAKGDTMRTVIHCLPYTCLHSHVAACNSQLGSYFHFNWIKIM